MQDGHFGEADGEDIKVVGGVGCLYWGGEDGLVGVLKRR